MEESEIIRLASTLRYEPAKFLFSYLGIPIGANMNLSKNWKPIIDKFNSKFSKWKVKALSFRGRLTLVRSVLGSLPLYYFSLSNLPKKVVTILEGLRRKFLWGGVDDNKKINWVAWDTLVKSKKLGGMGIGCLRSLNVALLVKWRWILKT